MLFASPSGGRSGIVGVEEGSEENSGIGGPVERAHSQTQCDSISVECFLPIWISAVRLWVKRDFGGAENPQAVFLLHQCDGSQVFPLPLIANADGDLSEKPNTPRRRGSIHARHF